MRTRVHLRGEEKIREEEKTQEGIFDGTVPKKKKGKKKEKNRLNQCTPLEGVTRGGGEKGEKTRFRTRMQKKRKKKKKKR